MLQEATVIFTFLYVMVVEHHLILSMPLIVAMGAWSRVGTMRFGVLLVTLLSLVWTPVVKELFVCDGSASADTLITDLCVRGVWEPQTELLFDIIIVDTDAQSHRACSPRDVLGLAEVEKKNKYLKACQDRRDTFTLLCVSVDGMLGSEAEFFVKRLCDFLAAR